MRPSRIFWPLAFGLVLTDCATKRAAEDHLLVAVPRDVAGEVLRFTLAYNPGAAFSTTLGPHSRWIFTVLTLLILGALVRMVRETPPAARLRLIALALVFGGAVGNLLDRLRSAQGVVDFIDVGYGGWRFWTFNVADMGVSIGAVLLAWALWREGARPAPQPRETALP